MALQVTPATVPGAPLASPPHCTPLTRLDNSPTVMIYFKPPARPQCSMPPVQHGVESDWGAQAGSSKGTGAYLLAMSTVHNHLKTKGVMCHHCYTQTRHQWLSSITGLNIHSL